MPNTSKDMTFRRLDKVGPSPMTVELVLDPEYASYGSAITCPARAWEGSTGDRCECCGQRITWRCIVLDAAGAYHLLGRSCATVAGLDVERAYSAALRRSIDGRLGDAGFQAWARRQPHPKGWAGKSLLDDLRYLCRGNKPSPALNRAWEAYQAWKSTGASLAPLPDPKSWVGLSESLPVIGETTKAWQLRTPLFTTWAPKSASRIEGQGDGRRVVAAQQWWVDEQAALSGREKARLEREAKEKARENATYAGLEERFVREYLLPGQEEAGVTLSDARRAELLLVIRTRCFADAVRDLQAELTVKQFMKQVAAQEVTS